MNHVSKIHKKKEFWQKIHRCQDFMSVLKLNSLYLQSTNIPTYNLYFYLGNVCIHNVVCEAAVL